MSATPDAKLRVLIAGAGVAGLEAALALRELAPERTARTVLSPAEQFAYRPMTVREPFSYAPAHRYPLAPILADARAEHVSDALAWVDPARQVAHTDRGAELEYDALLLALGAHARPRFAHALTIDDHTMDETLHGLLQDVEDGYTRRIAFVSPARMPWQLPLYELALMTAARAYDVGAELEITIVSPEDAPLAIFGAQASEAVSGLLARARIDTVYSAYAEVPSSGEVVVNPGDRRLSVDRIVALPELYGPSVRGIPVGDHGFLHVEPHMQVPGGGPVFAAGDATDFPVKHGGVSAHQADVAAESIAALAGAEVERTRFAPVIHGMLLTGDKPLYLTAHITGGQGFASEVGDAPTWPTGAKIAARYLAPYLAEHEAAGAR